MKIFLSLLFLVLTGCANSDSPKPASQPAPKENRKIPMDSGACETGEDPTTQGLVGIINGRPLSGESQIARSVVRLRIGYEKWVDGKFEYEGILCTGSLIDSRTILTAAHCLADVRSTGHILVDFDHDPACYRESSRSAKKPLSMVSRSFTSVQSYAVHENYRAEYYANDLALIRLNGDAPSHYQPVELASTRDGIESEPLVVGYGRIMNGDVKQKDPNTRLRFGWISSITDPQMFKGVENTLKARGMSDAEAAMLSSKVMLFDQRNENGICMGDSGGPLFYKQGGRWVQMAVASFVGQAWGQSEICRELGVHMSVPYFQEWIGTTKERLQGVRGRLNP